MQAPATAAPPWRRTSSTAACIVPPVANKSSITTTRCPGLIASCKAAADREGERRRDEKAPGFNPDQEIGAVRADRLRELLDRRAPGLGMRQQG